MTHRATHPTENGRGARGRGVGSRWEALALAVPVGLFVAGVAVSPSGLHNELGFAGTVERWVASGAAAADGARAALLVDLAFAVSVATIGTAVLARAARWTYPRRRRGGWRLVPYAALAAGVLDVVETLLVLAHFDGTPPGWLPPTVAAIRWWMLGAYALALFGAVGLVVGPALAPVLRPMLRRLFGLLDTGAHPPLDPPAASEPGPGEGIGIALSGGGIRAAAVALGALRALDTVDTSATVDTPATAAASARSSVFGRSRWVCAVSGGAYAAGGWRITRRPGGTVDPPASGQRDGLFDADGPWARSVAARRRFVDNGYGSLLGGVLGALARFAVVFGTVASAGYVVGFAAGRAVRSYAIHPAFGDSTALTPARLVWPWLPALVLAVALWLASGARRDAARARLRAAAFAIGSAALALATQLVGVPFGIQRGPSLFRQIAQMLTPRDSANAGAGILGLLTSLGIVSAVVGVLRSHATRRWLYLGGVAHAVAWLLLAGKVADSLARDDTAWPNRWQVGLPLAAATVPAALLVALAWIAAADTIAAHRLTLGGIYRKRLAGTFALTAPGPGEPAVPLPPLGYADEPAWSAYADGKARGPELIIAASAHSSKLEPAGVKGVALTFRPRAITLHRVPGADDSVPSWQYPRGSWWDGYPRCWLVSRSMALTGAAFASAMGRQALGTTNSLLAATNLRLGAWVPNPRHVDWFADPVTSPRVNLTYLVKELFGVYDLEHDAFVYVADGGHRENLGLVELLRERPRVAVVVDASGDRPGSFNTLREAIEVAHAELGIRIDVDWGPIAHPGEGQLGDPFPEDCVTTGTIHYPDGTQATLAYGRYQLSRRAPAALVAFAALDPKFPCYPTGDQFLTAAQFDHLVLLGEHVGMRLRDRVPAA